MCDMLSTGVSVGESLSILPIPHRGTCIDPVGGIGTLTPGRHVIMLLLLLLLIGIIIH